MTVHVVVLAGGRGVRLWPLSRERRPKFLIDMARGEPLLADALRRAVCLTDPVRVHIVTSPVYVEEVWKVAALYGVHDLVVEPSGRDTAAALCLATAAVARRDPEAVVVSLPADHLVEDAADRWADVMRRAVHAADAGALVCLGVAPATAETGLGYVRAPVGEDPEGIRPVLAFHEKPDAETARAYVESGEFYWNTAIMAWRVEIFEEMVAAYAPYLTPVLTKSPVDPGAWELVPRVAIEFALLEPAAADRRLLLAPARIVWRDIGSWTAVAALRRERHDEAVLERDGDGCFVLPAAGRRYALLGVRDLVVVDTGDVVLIADRNTHQSVKRFVTDDVGARWPDLL